MESQFHSDYFRAGREFERSHSVSAWVFEHQQSVVRGDLETEQQYPNDRRLVAEGILSDCVRSEEHTSELQSRPHLVCRLLLEKKKNFNSRLLDSKQEH